MELSANRAIASAFQAKTNVQNSEVAVGLVAKQLDAQKATGNAIVEMLSSIRPPAGTPGHHVNVRV